MLNNPNPDVNLNSTEISGKQEEYTLKKPLIAAPGDPNLTRVNYPVVLSNETATELWTALHNLSVDDFRIAYYSMDNKWEFVPFQLDEKGYFRSFIYNFGTQVEDAVSKVDLTNWGQYVAEKRYAGKDIDANETAAYKEPTKYECELGFWSTRLAEGWANSSLPVYPAPVGSDLVDNDTSTDPGRPTPTPILNPREAPGGIWDQLERRVDYDDEVVFYAQNGKKAGVDNWNLTRTLNRYEIELFDPVDGGQSWMYLYFNATSTVQNPTTNFFTPGGEDFVSWDKTNLKVTGQNYEYTIDVNNKDLGSNATVNLPGSAPTPLFTEIGKQWIAINLRVIQIAPPDLGGLLIFDLNDSADIWREGEWGYPPNRLLYNEQNTSIGYNIKMDLDLEKLDKWFPGQDDDYNNSHRHTGVGGQAHGGIKDIYTNGMDYTLPLLLSYSDDGDHDNVTDAEYAPFLRGIVDDSDASNEAAIDGPCRVVIDQFSVSVFSIDLGSGFLLKDLFGTAFPLDFGYEEYWSIARSTSKFYANMTSVDPVELTTNYSTGDPEQQIIAQLHYGFLAGQNFTTNVRNDPEAYVLLGQAPNGDAGLPDLTQCRDEGKTWPLKITPDGDGSNDDGASGLVSGGGPQAGHYDNTSLVTTSKESAPGAGDGNPLSDWAYIHTSGGGAWTYIPYNETWKLFTQEKYRDVAYYWNDNEKFTEMAVYGNHGDPNGKTDFFPETTVFGNFTDWECKREYARMKLRLEDSMILTRQSVDFDPPTWDPTPEDVKVQLGANFSYTVHAYDLNGIKEYLINDTTNFAIDSVSGEITNNTALSLAASPYGLMINASDYSLNNASAIITITVIDQENPVWLIDPKDQQVELGNSFSYTVSASDADGIKKYSIDDTTNFFIDPDNGIIINNTALVVGDYGLMINASDNLFNNVSAIITITVVDTTSPTWDEEPTDQTIGYLFPFNYDVNASDLSDIKEYSINDMTNFTIDSVSGVITNNTILSFGVNYRLMINASDFFNNNLSTIITITVVDLTKPFWVVVPTDQTVRIVKAEGNKAKLSYDVDANDIIGIDRYWINDTAFFAIDNDGLITSEVLRLGIYHVEIRAYDAADNYCSAIITVTVLRELETVKSYDKDDVDEILSEKRPIVDIYIGFAIVMIFSAAAIVISMILIKRR
ncbi:MAG: cadherin repeat domain-containing protein [Promethearchaeota archaeon]|nr:MAG: cadherin repeat domain-containing protein [Candidatus Lokiarchaeota archaeon]